MSRYIYKQREYLPKDIKALDQIFALGGVDVIQLFKDFLSFEENRFLLNIGNFMQFFRNWVNYTLGRTSNKRTYLFALFQMLNMAGVDFASNLKKEDIDELEKLAPSETIEMHFKLVKD